MWKEGYVRYTQLSDNIQNEENNIIDDSLIKFNFCMANELFDMNVGKEELMVDVKNQFLEMFFQKNSYGIKEKKYINDNIILLNKEGVIDLKKKAKESNSEGNNVIIPFLKDVTS